MDGDVVITMLGGRRKVLACWSLTLLEIPFNSLQSETLSMEDNEEEEDDEEVEENSSESLSLSLPLQVFHGVFLKFCFCTGNLLL